MGKTTTIRLLPEAVVNKIAAGEVVERPAAVVKELMENSIDARSPFIRLRLEGARGKFISVSDRGQGMSHDDALLALERHGTSKISSISEIENLSTMGFRGEALSSIAAVSHLTLETKRSGDAVGTRVDVWGGRIRSVSEAALPVGTTVKVRRLFFNTPARRKFLRAEATEKSHLFKAFIKLSLAHSVVRMELEYNGRRIYTLPSSKNVMGRLTSLFGETLAASMMPVQGTLGTMVLEGFVADPALLPPGSYEYFFVNGRPVEDRLINLSVREVFRRFFPNGKRAAFILYLKMEPRGVDVNVHPTKREVRFKDPIQVKNLVGRTITEGFRSGRPPQGMAFLPREMDFITKAGGQTGASDFDQRQEWLTGAERRAVNYGPREDIKEETIADESFHCLGQVMDGYLVVAEPERLLLIDQHAAHERVIFEEVRKRLANGPGVSQKLLWPEDLEVQPQDYRHLEESLPFLEETGCILEPFGPRNFRILALPPEVRSEEIREFIGKLMDLLEETGEALTAEPAWRDRVASLVACHGAIKLGEPIGPEKMKALVKDLLSCEDPYHCPHGRPTVKAISRDELEKLFARR